MIALHFKPQGDWAHRGLPGALIVICEGGGLRGVVSVASKEKDVSTMVGGGIAAALITVAVWPAMANTLPWVYLAIASVDLKSCCAKSCCAKRDRSACRLGARRPKLGFALAVLTACAPALQISQGPVVMRLKASSFASAKGAEICGLCDVMGCRSPAELSKYWALFAPLNRLS